MGRNLISCCHKCKEQCYHFRGEEQETILPFYIRHTECMRIDYNNVETLDDQLQERDWMRWGGQNPATPYKEWERSKLEKLGNLINKAINEEPPKKILDMCGKYYQPYYHLMYLLATEVKGGDIVELGVSNGYGVASFAYGNPDVKVIGLDLNISPTVNLPSNVDFYLMSALPVPDFIRDVAVLHVDTEHSYNNACNEFGQYKPHLLPGAVVLFDDLHAMDDGVLKCFKELPYEKIQDDRLHPVNGYGVLIYDE